MALFERLRSQETTAAKTERFGWKGAPEPAARDAYQELKTRVHHRLIEKLDLSTIDSLSRDQLRSQVKVALEQLVSTETLPLSRADRERLVEEVVNETLGLGPLEPLLADPTISDILVNGYDQVYIERFGKLELTGVKFKDDNHVRQIIDRIVAAVGRRVDEASPMVDARLQDGSRVNAIIAPLSIDGPVLSIRRFGANPLTANDLLTFESITPAMLELLKGAVKARLNVLISGGTGAGKTTLLNILSGYVPGTERIITIEDAAELQLQQEHVVRLETRPPNIEGKGRISQRDLVRNALRMRPDRIIVGEVRGEEALDMLQAMNTGHDGSLTTIHANSPRDSLSRLETMVLMSGMDLPEKAIREQVASAIDVVIQISRLSDGRRKIDYVSEIVGMEGSVVTMQDIFVYERMGLAEDGTVLGQFKPTGIRPKFAERLFIAGVHLPSGIFDETD
ncbi:MAG: CpaF family protein [Candidatus Eiseniibacteriota bacterium]|nr:MAG: CpaF family protein [Candidatus Eisenbacteria bacterium]